MTAQELRIGNHVVIDDELLSVTAISDIGDVHVIQPFDDHDQIASIDWIKPIPLTPAVLEACGFEYEKKNIKWKINKNTGLEFAWGEDFGTQFGYSTCRRNVSHINFLHQLQNIYYLFTDQEFQIDIEKLKNAIK